MKFVTLFVWLFYARKFGPGAISWLILASSSTLKKTNQNFKTFTLLLNFAALILKNSPKSEVWLTDFRGEKLGFSLEIEGILKHGKVFRRIRKNRSGH